MTFRELELISFLSASLVHGSQAVLIGPYLRAKQGIPRTSGHDSGDQSSSIMLLFDNRDWSPLNKEIGYEKE